eukprot:scaffold631_cov378-Prasinococcus_capsulatus_cf.AAC.24
MALAILSDYKLRALRERGRLDVQLLQAGQLGQLFRKAQQLPSFTHLLPQLVEACEGLVIADDRQVFACNAAKSAACSRNLRHGMLSSGRAIPRTSKSTIGFRARRTKRASMVATAAVP